MLFSINVVILFIDQHFPSIRVLNQIFLMFYVVLPTDIQLIGILSQILVPRLLKLQLLEVFFPVFFVMLATSRS